MVPKTNSYSYDSQFPFTNEIYSKDTNTLVVNNPQLPSINYFRRIIKMNTGEIYLQEIYINILPASALPP
jgi:hypothetical protein